MCTRSHRSTARRSRRVLHRPTRTVVLTDVWCLRPAPWSMAKAWLRRCRASTEAPRMPARARRRGAFRTPRRPCACGQCLDVVRALSRTELRSSPCNSTATPWPSTRVQVEDAKHRSARVGRRAVDRCDLVHMLGTVRCRFHVTCQGGLALSIREGSH